ncbi:hypothetical protein [Humisphaera borealis]|uniref:Uncharacterized protein n=1 Tax=Humisphaera borealis TaxID=2807512 RepID=A0A7M2WPQ7_9BACT|nr:hypothetical protein [Humisphaera borealis]QOV87446.1 hypothetical protein IPV69_14225 [Humisphaera borealis]
MKLLIPLLLALLLSGSSDPEHVTPSEFKKQYAEVGMPQSMHSVTYLGRREGRAYIKRSSMSAVSRKWSDHVIYVELTELDANFRDSLPKTEMKDSK